MNKEEFNIYHKKWRDKNKERVNERKRIFRRTNKESVRNSNHKYRVKNKKLKNFLNRKRQKIIIRATPSWADQKVIREIYLNCPDGYQVDHIFPLQGKEVCGLHVENNLQYLLASDNIAKGNRMIRKRG